MAIRMPRNIHTKQILQRFLLTASNAASSATDVSKGYLAVYDGEGEKKKFVIPISMMNQPSFQCLLSQAEEEFGYDNPMGGLAIPCREDTFVDLISSLSQF